MGPKSQAQVVWHLLCFFVCLLKILKSKPSFRFEQKGWYIKGSPGTSSPSKVWISYVHYVIHSNLSQVSLLEVGRWEWARIWGEIRNLTGKWVIYDSCESQIRWNLGYMLWETTDHAAHALFVVVCLLAEEQFHGLCASMLCLFPGVWVFHLQNSWCPCQKTVFLVSLGQANAPALEMFSSRVTSLLHPRSWQSTSARIMLWMRDLLMLSLENWTGMRM